MSTLLLRHLCHIRQRRQRFAETFSVGVFFGGFPKTPKRFGVFDIPKSIGLVWWSLPLAVDERFPGAPVAPHPSDVDLTYSLQLEPG
jgi:hypothetical protein